MNKIKLLYIAPHPIQYNIGIFKEVSKLENIEFKVIFEDSIGLKPIFVKEFNKTIAWDIDLLSGYKYKFLKNYSFNSVGGFFSRINPSIISTLWNEKPDVVMLHGYSNLSDWIVFFVVKILKVKLIFRGEAVLKGNENSNGWKQKLKRFVLPRFLNNCDMVMYSCTGNKDYWKFYGVDENKMLPMPCAVDNHFYRNERKKHIDKVVNIRNELNIPKDNFVILFSARFTTRKRPLDLLQALSIIDNSNLTVLFVGDGPERSNMEEYVNNNNNNINAIFVGFKNQIEISKYYTISNLNIVISDYDPSPKAMNEAMNFELPIIVTDVIGTSSDLVKNGKNGFIVKVGDIKTIASKIDFLNKNRDVSNQMEKKSLEIVDQWTFEKDAYWIAKAVEIIMEK
jgi:glycosyltransferase involved in cell wall biosynthesis